jgi:hypothetical protein
LEKDQADAGSGFQIHPGLDAKPQTRRQGPDKGPFGRDDLKIEKQKYKWVTKTGLPASHFLQQK